MEFDTIGNKYQQEPGGALRNEHTGKQLFEYKRNGTPVYFKDIPEPFIVRKEKWLLLPQYYVFGSEELSSYANAINELSPRPYIAMSAYDADQLGVVEGSLLSIKVFEQTFELPVKASAEIPNGIALMPAALAGMPGMNWNSWIQIMSVKL